MRARWNTSTSCSAPERSYGSSGRNRSVPGKSDGSPRKSYGSAERSRRVRPEWRQMSGGFSCIPQRLAGFNAFRGSNRANNARFFAAHFKMSDLPPLVWTSLGPEALYGTKLGSKMSVSPPPISKRTICRHSFGPKSRYKADTNKEMNGSPPLVPPLISNPLARPSLPLQNRCIPLPSIALP